MKTFIEYINEIENNKSITNSPYDYNHEFKKWTVFLEKRDACYHKVKSRYHVWPSAYGSGALVKCRKVGARNWGNSKKNETTELNEDIFTTELNEDIFKAEKEKGLRGWFDRNKGKGWIDCKSSKKGKLVSCGRKKAGKGTERKYPACRPTLSACNKTGIKRKKNNKPISWKKKMAYENVIIPPENENEQPLKSIKEIKPLIPILISKAQNVYDNWEQDDQRNDEEYGSGGVCHTIADEIASVLNDHGIDATTVSAQQGTQHVWTIAKFEEGVYEIDIPPNIYEIGAAYTWKKIPNVKFDAEDIVVSRIDSDPESFNNYIE